VVCCGCGGFDAYVGVVCGCALMRGGCACVVWGGGSVLVLWFVGSGAGVVVEGVVVKRCVGCGSLVFGGVVGGVLGCGGGGWSPPLYRRPPDSLSAGDKSKPLTSAHSAAPPSGQHLKGRCLPPRLPAVPNEQKICPLAATIFPMDVRWTGRPYVRVSSFSNPHTSAVFFFCFFFSNLCSFGFSRAPLASLANPLSGQQGFGGFPHGPSSGQKPGNCPRPPRPRRRFGSHQSVSTPLKTFGQKEYLARLEAFSCAPRRSQQPQWVLRHLNAPPIVGKTRVALERDKAVSGIVQRRVFTASKREEIELRRGRFSYPQTGIECPLRGDLPAALCGVAWFPPYFFRCVGLSGGVVAVWCVNAAAVGGCVSVVCGLMVVDGSGPGDLGCG